MATQGDSSRLLPRELMELQLGQIDLLMAMYAADDAVSMDDSCTQQFEKLKAWCDGDETSRPEITATSLSAHLRLALLDEDAGASSSDQFLELVLSFPVTLSEGDATDESLHEPPKINFRVPQASWMTRAEAAQLAEGIPDDDMLGAIEHVKEAASSLLSNRKSEAQSLDGKNNDEDTVRIWFYFPSISTRSKRDDIVNYAPAYGLTGFLLAGKPGVLCLEGGSNAIDEYMRFIKTESWSDIPPQHKKVSERFRESGPNLQRAFKNMREVTDDFGERRGVRANRNDMKTLETFLIDNGVGEAFTKVFI